MPGSSLKYISSMSMKMEIPLKNIGNGLRKVGPIPGLTDIQWARVLYQNIRTGTEKS